MTDVPFGTTLARRLAKTVGDGATKDSHAFNANSLPTYMALYGSISSETAIIREHWKFSNNLSLDYN